MPLHFNIKLRKICTEQFLRIHGTWCSKKEKYTTCTVCTVDQTCRDFKWTVTQGTALKILKRKKEAKATLQITCEMVTYFIRTNAIFFGSISDLIGGEHNTDITKTSTGLLKTE